MIELTLADEISGVAKSGDSVILKDDGTFEIKKTGGSHEFAGYSNFSQCEKENKDKGDPGAYCGSIKRNVEENKTADKPITKYDERIEKYLSIDKEQAWSLLTKFYNNGHLDSYKVLKDFINKVALCPDVTEKFDKIMEKWISEGEADISPIEKVINSCKSEGGNIDKAQTQTQLNSPKPKKVPLSTQEDKDREKRYQQEFFRDM